MVKIIFGYFAVVIIASALIGITRKNLVYSLLWILLMFIHLGGLYLLLNAEFLAMVQLIVYAGAILVMFLFVVFLLNLKEEIKEAVFLHKWSSRLYGIIFLLFFAFLGVWSYKNEFKGIYSIEFIEKEGHPKVIGTVLFNEYIFPFLILGFILLVPLLGVGIVALRRKTNGTT